MKEHEFEKTIDLADKAEYTDFLLVEGEIFPEVEMPNEVVDGLPEVIDEDWLYEAYRDDKFDRQKRGK